MDETALIEKLRAIEALFSGATTPGERDAAAHARERIASRLTELRKLEPEVEYRFTLPDAWSSRVMIALLRRHGIRPYRYRRQRRTTVMARGPRRFFEETLRPEFTEIAATLRRYLEEVTDRVISEAVHDDGSDAAVVSEPRQLRPSPEVR